MSKPNPFVNRITGYGTKPADQFQANALNYRKHPQRQRDAMQASLRELGWIGVVVENTVTGNLIDGHERVWQALANNEDVPYIQVELSEAEEKLALAIFDPIGAMAETDSAILDELLRDVNTGEAALQELLAELAEDAGLYGDATKERTASMGTLDDVDGYDFHIDAAKLGYRIEAVAHCDKRGGALELFAGLGLLTYWYSRLFDDIVRVDASADGHPDFVTKAEKYLQNEFDPSQPFDFVDFDDEGCPSEPLRIFFGRIAETRWPPFVLCLTDGGGLNLKVRGKVNTFKDYRWGEDKLIKASTELYEAHTAMVEHHLTTIAANAGYAVKRISLYRGSLGNVTYGCYRVVPS